MISKPRDHPYAELLGIEVESTSNGQCTSKITFDRKLLNPNNVIHGGVIYSLADTGMGGALTSVLPDGKYCATIEIKIAYLKPAGKFDLICQTKLLRQGKKVAFLESEVFSNDDLIAKASGSFAIF